MARWTPLAAKFPASLAKDVAPELLEDGLTPDAYGLGLDEPGSLYPGSIQTGTTRLTATTATAPGSNFSPHTITGATWYYWEGFERLWGHVGTNIIVGAYGYKDQLYAQGGFGLFPFSYGTGNIVTLIPFGNSVAAVKSDCTMVINRATDRRGGFDDGIVIQDFFASASTDVTEYAGQVYASNASGIFRLSENGKVEELSYPIRNNLGNLTGADLKAVYTQGRIIGNDGTKKYTVDAATGGLYDYSTSGFRWTSRTLAMPDEKRLRVPRLAFLIRLTNDSDATMSYQVKGDDDVWKDEESVVFRNEYDGFAWVEVELPDEMSLVQQKWAMRITAMSSNLRINQVNVLLEEGDAA